ncbi:hypothetical protein B7486_39705 [cyanobacterium TDX16]|nr:hypothetical protein B7486_39705 [cyanobacterium TDX16]
MTVKISKKSVKEIIEEAKQLTNRERYLLGRELLKLMKLDYLVQLEEDLEQITTLKVVEEDRTAIDIEFLRQPYRSKKTRKLGYHTYVQISRWGAKKTSIYIGPVYFLPSVKYRIVFKESNEQQILIGLGYHRISTQVFLKVLYLSPHRYVESYLVYDTDLEPPTLPRIELEAKLFKKIDIECLEIVSDDPEISRETEQDLSPPFVEVAELAIAESRSKSKTPEIFKITTQTVFDETETNELQPTKAPKNLLSIRKGKKISQKLESKVIECLEQWTSLSKVLDIDHQLKLLIEVDSLTVVNTKGNVLVTYDRSKQLLFIENIRFLGERIKLIMKAVTNSDSASYSQKLVAQRWQDRVSSAPSGADEMLVHLFFL